GIGSAPLHIGMKNIFKLTSAINRAEKIHREVLDIKTTPHWTVYALCVVKEHQREGTGGSLLLQILKSADAMNVPIYTAVFNPNMDMMRFWRRHGFEIKKKTPSSKYCPEFWSLVRQHG